MAPINFYRGHPNSSLLPTSEMMSLLSQMTISSSPDVQNALTKSLQYGEDPGDFEFRAELVAFLERQCQNDEGSVSSSSPSNFFITGGVSHGIELLCATQTQPNDIVLVERPTYFLVGNIFKSHGLKIDYLPISSEHGGVDVQQLIDRVETMNNSRPPPRMIYVIPTHQNPTGRTMSLEDRKLLVDFAERHDILLVADEVYHLLDWRQPTSVGGDPSPRPARMFLLNNSSAEAAGRERSTNGKLDSLTHRRGGCVSVSSFTKIFAPGIRCGWLEGSPAIIESLVQYGYITSQGGIAPFVGEIMKRALASRMTDSILQNLQACYRDRVERLVDKLKSEPRIEIVCRPLGGYFLWIKLPEGVISEDFLFFCRDKVTFMPGVRCDPSTNDKRIFESHARLCFADLPVEQLEKGADEMISCLCKYVDKIGSSS